MGTTLDKLLHFVKSTRILARISLCFTKFLHNLSGAHHNDNIKTFDDVGRHVELEEDRLLVDKPYEEAYMIESKKIGAFDSGQKK